jgi:chromosome segregation ATPase
MQDQDEPTGITKVDRDREIDKLTKKLELLRENIEKLKLEKNEVKENIINIHQTIVEGTSKKEVTLKLIDNFSEPYEALQKIIEAMRKEVDVLSRGKMNELRRMTKPPLLIKKTVELGKFKFKNMIF